jgi:hypothetical protein
MRIEEDEEGNYWLVIENKKDFEEFKKMLLEAIRDLEEKEKDKNPHRE